MTEFIGAEGDVTLDSARRSTSFGFGLYLCSAPLTAPCGDHAVQGCVARPPSSSCADGCAPGRMCRSRTRETEFVNTLVEAYEQVADAGRMG